MSGEQVTCVQEVLWITLLIVIPCLIFCLCVHRTGYGARKRHGMELSMMINILCSVLIVDVLILWWRLG